MQGADSPATQNSQPTISRERCVHHRFGNASCQHCVEACPRRAWSINEDQLTFNKALCDGCMRCCGVCPEGVLENPLTPTIRNYAGSAIALFSCRHAGDVEPQAEGSEFCVHGIGVRQLVALHQRGVDTLFVRTGNCDECECGGKDRLERLVENFSRLLTERLLPAIGLRKVTADKWHRLLQESLPFHTEEGMSRRDFFRRIGQQAEEGEKTSSLPTPPGQRLLTRGPHLRAFYAPKIDAHRCNGCNACFRLCQYDALQQTDEAYLIDADRCSGCGLCVDVCEERAVSVHTFVIPEANKIALRALQCPACGITHREPAVRPQRRFCPVCDRTAIYKNLFQVFE